MPTYGLDDQSKLCPQFERVMQCGDLLLSNSSSKLSLSMNNVDNKDGNKTDSPRTYIAAKRFVGDSSSHGRSNPFNAISPLTTNIASPSSGASSAFGLGSGAFASFGSSGKTPKTPGSGFDNGATKGAGEKREKDEGQGISASSVKSKQSASSLGSSQPSASSEHPLKSTWVIWYRPPTSKYSDYEKSTIALASISTVESFWTIYSYLKRPSLLPSVSDYHIFKKGIRPVWEDEANKKGGKWIVRLKKGVSDRYWEDLLLAMVGDQFAEAGEEVCGAVLSVRSGEDVLSVWTRIDGGRNIKIRLVFRPWHSFISLTINRETIKRLLSFPPDTSIVWKSHDDSIAQRSAIDQARHEKGGANSGYHGSEKRRMTIHEDSMPDKGKAPA